MNIIKHRLQWKIKAKWTKENMQAPIFLMHEYSQSIYIFWICELTWQTYLFTADYIHANPFPWHENCVWMSKLSDTVFSTPCLCNFIRYHLKWGGGECALWSMMQGKVGWEVFWLLKTFTTLMYIVKLKREITNLFGYGTHFFPGF